MSPEELTALSKKFTDDLQSLRHTIQRLVWTMEGSPGVPGLVQRISELEKIVAAQREFQTKVIGGFIVISILSDALLRYLIK